jgi:hypothetical protein
MAKRIFQVLALVAALSAPCAVGQNENLNISAQQCRVAAAKRRVLVYLLAWYVSCVLQFPSL